MNTSWRCEAYVTACFLLSIFQLKFFPFHSRKGVPSALNLLIKEVCVQWCWNQHFSQQNLLRKLRFSGTLENYEILHITHNNWICWYTFMLIHAYLFHGTDGKHIWMRVCMPVPFWFPTAPKTQGPKVEPFSGGSYPPSGPGWGIYYCTQLQRATLERVGVWRGVRWQDSSDEGICLKVDQYKHRLENHMTSTCTHTHIQKEVEGLRY